MATHSDPRAGLIPAAPRVLIIEDDADYALLLCDAMEPYGLVIDAIGSVREALQRDYDSYDSIILDYRLPDGCGLAVLASITGTCVTPVIMLTGEDDVGTAVSALKAGAQNYLVKTRQNLEAIGEIVRQGVEECRRRREYQRQSEFMRRAQHLAGMGTLVSGLCHEMNNPLAGMLGHGELFLNGMAQDATPVVEAMMDGARRIRDVVKSLTAFATGDMPPLGTIDVAEVVRSEIAAQHEAFAHSGVAVQFEDPGVPVNVRADAPSVSQVVSHVLRNARGAMEGRQERRLAVWLQRAHDAVLVEFEDTGPGVPPHLRERIFEPFYTTHEPNEGMGLGLAICHGIVSRLGGRIWCEAGSTGGALIVVELPAVATHPNPVPAVSWL